MLVGISTSPCNNHRSHGFAPSSISGLKLWLDASDSSTIPVSGNSVSSWNDKSGNLNHALQSTPTNQPLSTVFSGYPCVYFSTDDSLDILTNSGLIYGSSGATIIVVAARHLRPTASNLVFVSPQSNTTGMILRYSSTTSNAIRCSSRMLPADGIVTAAATKNPALDSVVYSIATAEKNGSVNLYQKSSSTITTAGLSNNDFTAGSNPAVTIGSSWHSTPASKVDFFDGYVFEVMIYNRVLSDTERNKIVQYIDSKWTNV